MTAPGVELFGCSNLSLAKAIPIARLKYGRVSTEAVKPRSIEYLAVKAYYGRLDPVEEVVDLGDDCYGLSNGNQRAVLTGLLFGEGAHMLSWDVRKPYNLNNCNSQLVLAAFEDEKNAFDSSPFVLEVVEREREGLIRIVQPVIERLDEMERNRASWHRFVPFLFPIPRYENTDLSDQERESPVLTEYRFNSK